MADGIVCRHCGWQETSHSFVERDENYEEVLPGYAKSLINCPGYIPENQQLAHQLSKRATRERHGRCMDDDFIGD